MMANRRKKSNKLIVGVIGPGQVLSLALSQYLALSLSLTLTLNLSLTLNLTLTFPRPCP